MGCLQISATFEYKSEIIQKNSVSDIKLEVKSEKCSAFSFYQELNYI